MCLQNSKFMESKSVTTDFSQFNELWTAYVKEQQKIQNKLAREDTNYEIKLQQMEEEKDFVKCPKLLEKCKCLSCVQLLRVLEQHLRRKKDLLDEHIAKMLPVHERLKQADERIKQFAFTSSKMDLSPDEN